jgi:hypothetical protein
MIADEIKANAQASESWSLQAVTYSGATQREELRSRLPAWPSLRSRDPSAEVNAAYHADPLSHRCRAVIMG